jgi:hypothetical protein
MLSPRTCKRLGLILARSSRLVVRGLADFAKERHSRFRSARACGRGPGAYRACPTQGYSLVRGYCACLIARPDLPRALQPERAGPSFVFISQVLDRSADKACGARDHAQASTEKARPAFAAPRLGFLLASIPRQSGGHKSCVGCERACCRASCSARRFCRGGVRVGRVGFGGIQFVHEL